MTLSPSHPRTPAGATRAGSAPGRPTTGHNLDVDAYLERIGCLAPSSPTRGALLALQAAHLETIPFENLDILLGRPISLDLGALQEKLVDQQRGGYGFEQNTLFRAVLEALGYRAAPLAARLRTGAPRVSPRTHMPLLVEVEGKALLADVGLGVRSPLQPLDLETGRETRVGGVGYRLRYDGGLWILDRRSGPQWSELYEFWPTPRDPLDFVMASHLASTSPASTWRTALVAERAWIWGGAVLRDRDLRLLSKDDEERITIRDADHLLEVLDRHFGIALPPDTRFPIPEF